MSECFRERVHAGEPLSESKPLRGRRYSEADTGPDLPEIVLPAGDVTEGVVRIADPPLVASETKMQPQGFIKFRHEHRRESAGQPAESLHRYGPDLLSLSLGIPCKTGFGRWQQHLERVYPGHVRCDRNDGDDTASKPGGCRVGTVVTDDDDGPALVCLGTAHRIQISKQNVSTLHQRLIPSAAVVSHTPASPDSSHSRQASA